MNINIMRPGQSPQECFLPAGIDRREVEDAGETISNSMWKNVLVKGLTAEYDNINLTAYRDSDFTGCYNCSEEGHFQHDYKKNAARGTAPTTGTKAKKTAPSKRGNTANGKKGGTGQKWCSVHKKNTKHNDADFYQEGAPRPKKSKVNVAAAPAPSSRFTGGFCLRQFPTANA